jgi:hypothetical protein
MLGHSSDYLVCYSYAFCSNDVHCNIDDYIQYSDILWLLVPVLRRT